VLEGQGGHSWGAVDPVADPENVSPEKIAEVVIQSLKRTKFATSYKAVFTGIKWDVVSWFETDVDHKVRTILGQFVRKGYILSNRSRPDVLIIVSETGALTAYKKYRALDLYPSKGHRGRRIEGSKINSVVRPKNKTANLKLNGLPPRPRTVKYFCLDALGADENLFDDVNVSRYSSSSRKSVEFDPFEDKPLSYGNSTTALFGRKKRNKQVTQDVFEMVGEKYGGIERG